ncbi:hypothetical protein Pint_24662 [Pistacia integerrima]|uniref:Uncharacterized protein n=1 Tax=Pistacia integerrima TaxID=434235 RepID=A0ACC0YAD3_9ROSI|nr:hypothetical protein Pint_24662 [Pistacia integerrima]
MHSFWYRANALLTFAVTILALLCATASISDNLNNPSSTAEIQVLNINWFQKQTHGNDEVSLTLNITADLQSLFTWNTKQVDFPRCLYLFSCRGFYSYLLIESAFPRLNPIGLYLLLFIFVAAEYKTPKNALNQVSLWDDIIPTKESAKFSIHTSNKYRFIDQGHNLRGKEFNLTLHWHVMPKTGKMFVDKIVMSGYRLPEEYR